MDKERFKIEIVPLRSRLVSYASHLLGSKEDAEDIVQEVYLKLWDIREQLEQYRNLPGLSVQITKHLCLNKLKTRERVYVNCEEHLLVYDHPAPDCLLEEKEAVRHLFIIIDKLSDLQQSILKMRHVDGLEVEEISSLTGCSVEAVRMNLSRARKRVRELFFKMEEQ